MAFLMDHLLKQAPFSYDEQEKKYGGSFYQALLEELCFHYDHNALYRRFCEHKGFCPHGYTGAIEDIPPVQVSVFKELGRKLASVPTEDVKLTLQSSATSGIPSSIPVDKVTAKRQAKAMVRVVGDFIGNERKPFLIMDVDPATGFRHLLGARFAAVSGYLNFASRAGYFLKVNEQQHYYFDVAGIQQYIASLNGEPAVVFGFTFILFSEVVRPLEEQGIHFQLPQGSKIIHIGGWKKLEEQRVDKQEFNQRLAQLFGIEPSDVIDIYGFTEQMGLNYPDCRCGCKHASLYSQVIVRDVRTKEVLPPGETGLLEFVSPLPHSYPGNVVLTDDIGYIDGAACAEGRAGTRFTVVGRLKKAEIRGCGDILSSKLKFADTDTHTEHHGPSFRVDHFTAEPLNDVPAEEILPHIEKALRHQQQWLMLQPIDAMIGLIGEVARKWADADDSSLDNLRTKGLGFLTAWCKPEHLATMLNEGLQGNRLHLDGFVPIHGSSVESQFAKPRGLACHWLAGNVQILGMFVLILSMLTKNANIIKVSSRDEGVFCQLLQAFAGTSFTSRGGYTIYGDDLLKTIAVVYFPHTDRESGRQMSQMADIRVAWGGAEAVGTVSSLPARYDCSDLIMGPKLSFAVVANEMLMDEHQVKKLARKVAVDASVFDQTGCASAHNVFVERGGAISPAKFATKLADGMRKVALQIPSGGLSAEQIAAIHSARGIYDFKGQVYGDPDSVWTVLYSEDEELNSPVYSRVVFVHPVDHICDVIPYVSDDIQTIGLAAQGRKATDFAVQAARKGAVRFPAPGRMLNFESPWDGMYLPDRMVRWVTLGGPRV